MTGQNLQKSIVGTTIDRSFINSHFKTVVADLDHACFFCVGSHMDSNQHATTTMIRMLLLPNGPWTSHTFMESAIPSSRLTQSRLGGSVHLPSSHCENLVVGESELLLRSLQSEGYSGG